MENEQRLRDAMVDYQLIVRGIKDRRVLDAMRTVPRSLFVPEPYRQFAYEDRALPIGEDQTISQPYMVGVMTELLSLTGVEKVLEIGTGSGYQAAVLSALAKEVYTVERIPTLAARAEGLFAALKYDNVRVMVHDGTEGLIAYAPYDRIIVTAAAPALPEPLLAQLVEDGIIVIPVGDRFSQTLIKGTKKKDGLRKEYHTPCVFVPLIGKHGWN